MHHGVYHKALKGAMHREFPVCFQYISKQCGDCPHQGSIDCAQVCSVLTSALEPNPGDGGMFVEKVMGKQDWQDLLSVSR